MMSASAGSHWRLLASDSANDLLPVTKYESEKTGLKLVVADVEGPLVNGYFCLATEAHDDDGLPHTLEHLIFMGSKQMPYKGILDLIANRCLSSGTNAWTDTDHTCYTMTTVGSEGFLSMLPVYVEHVLWPTLTPAGYVTEVHHVNGEGEDAGVVYCEMQGRENSGESRLHLEMLRSLYPGKCGYKSETGGIMKNLRESTSHKKVVDYHKAFYRPENLVLIITGKIEPGKIFSALEPIEKQILSERVSSPPEPFLRPWQDPVPALASGLVREVAFPCDDEDNGMVYVAWRGPSAATQLRALFATIVLMEYLTESSISPLKAAFVESEDPLASTVEYSVIENSDCTVYLMFDNVPKEKIPEVEPLLSKTLDSLASEEESSAAFDMERMRTVVQRRVQQELESSESNPHEATASKIIADAIYGTNNDNFNVRLNAAKSYGDLLDEPVSFWAGLLQDILSKKRAVLKGVPSKSLQESMAAEEKARVEAQRVSLGEEGLKEKAKVVDEAMEENEKEAPDSLFDNFAVPGIDSINFHPIKSWTSDEAASAAPHGIDLSKAKVNAHFSDVKSNFVNLWAIMDTADLQNELRPYLPLFESLILESAVEKNGSTISHEEVIRNLNHDTLTAHACTGVGGRRFGPGAFSQLFTVFLQLQRDGDSGSDGYGKGFEWLRDLLFGTVFTADRAKVVATKMENGIAEMRRQGRTIAASALQLMLYPEGSNKRASNLITQQAFLKDVLRKLKDTEAGDVVKALNRVRETLTAKFAVYAATNFSQVKAPLAAFDTLIPKETTEKISKPSFIPESSLGLIPTSRHVVIGLGSVESSFLMRSVPGSVIGYDHPDYAPLMLFLQYLTQLEGPMWRKIRGAGLAYGYYVMPIADQGTITLGLTKSTHPAKAYEAAKAIVMATLEKDFEWNPIELESAKSSLIFEMVESETTVTNAVSQAVLRSLRGLPESFKKGKLDKVMRVTESDLRHVGEKYVSKIFSVAETKTVIVCHPDKVEETSKAFKEKGIVMEAYSSLEEATKKL